jgi:hypothetical protein
MFVKKFSRKIFSLNPLNESHTPPVPHTSHIPNFILFYIFDFLRNKETSGKGYVGGMWDWGVCGGLWRVVEGCGGFLNITLHIYVNILCIKKYIRKKIYWYNGGYGGFT